MSRNQHLPAYNPFAWYFDRYWADSFAKDVRPILGNWVLPRLPPGGRILDLCCGTGQLCQWLTACGFRVTGLDLSKEMIRYAKSNAAAAEFLVADARAFSLPPVFDAVISTFDSLNHIPNEQELFSVFHNTRQALVDGGLFFFDVNTEEGFEATAPATYAVVKDDHVCIVESSYDVKTRQGCSAITTFHRETETWRRNDFEILEYAYPESDIRRWLETAGFERIVSEDAERELGMDRGLGRLFFLASKKSPPKQEGG